MSNAVAMIAHCLTHQDLGRTAPACPDCASMALVQFTLVRMRCATCGSLFAEPARITVAPCAICDGGDGDRRSPTDGEEG